MKLSGVKAGGSIHSGSAFEHVAKQVRQKSAKLLIAGSSPAMFSMGVRQRWRVEPDCKSGASCLVGSNPTTPTQLKSKPSRSGRSWSLMLFTAGYVALQFGCYKVLPISGPVPRPTYKLEVSKKFVSMILVGTKETKRAKLQT